MNAKERRVTGPMKDVIVTISEDGSLVRIENRSDHAITFAIEWRPVTASDPPAR